MIKKTIKIKSAVCEIYSRENKTVTTKTYDFLAKTTAKAIRDYVKQNLSAGQYLLEMKVEVKKVVYVCTISEFLSVAHIQSEEVTEK